MTMASDTYLQQAFELHLKEVKRPESWFVVLFEVRPFYGGPEEGGWWGQDELVVAWKQFNCKQSANLAKAEVEHLATGLANDSERSFGENCLEEMEWLEARGLDADWLPEPDGPSKFRVAVTSALPQDSYGNRGYE